MQQLRKLSHRNEHEMSNKPKTRRCYAPRPEAFTWLVLVGPELNEVYIETAIPDEDYIRRRLGVPTSIPILVGRP